MGVPTQLMQDQVTQLYIGFFGRAPDAIGFGYWVNGRSNGVTQQQIANSFATSPEFVSNYGGLTPSQAVTKMYNNILNRAPDSAGLTFWANSIAAGQNTLSTCVVAILNSCVAQGTGTADGALVANKTTVGEYFAITLASNDTAVAATAYNGVTSSTSSIAPAEQALQQAAATQFQLTTGTDTGSAFTATTDGTFNAAATYITGTATLANTLNNSDSITGGSGTNTLNANIIETAGTVLPSGLTRIQNVQVSNSLAGGATTLDLTNDASIANVTVQNTTQSMTVQGIQLATAALATKSTATNVTFTTLASALTGAADTATVTVQDMTGTGNLTISSGFDTMALTSSVVNATANTISTEFAGAITLAGAANTTLTGTADATVSSTNVNASAFTGTLVTALSDSATTIVGGSGNTTITGGAGANTVTYGNGTNLFKIDTLAHLTTDTVRGGTGVDSLTFTANVSDAPTGGTATEVALANVSSFATLNLSSTGTNDITVGTNFRAAGFSAINGGSSADIVIMTGAFSGTSVNGGTGEDTVTFNNTASGTVTVAAVETVNVGSAQASGAVTLTVGASTGNVSITLATGNADSVTIADSYSGQVSVASVDTVSMGATHAGNTILLNGGVGATVVNITGTGTSAVTINALYGNTVGTNADSINMGAGADTLTVFGLGTVSNDATVVGGAGIDTLNIAASNTVAGVDASFAKISGVEVLTMGNTGANTLTVGTNFINAGFNTINMGGSGDAVVLSGATFSGLTLNGGTGVDTVQFANTGGGSITIGSVETVTTSLAGSIADTVTLKNAATGASVGISLGAGTDTVINLNTAGATVTLTSVESYVGVMGSDTITLGSTAATTISGGGGVDVLTLGANIANASVTQGGNTGSMAIMGNTASGDVLTIIGAGTYRTTAVETVNVSSGVAASITADVRLTGVTSGVTAGDNVLYAYTLGANNTASFTLVNQTAATTGGSTLLTITAAAGDTITINNSALLAGQTGDILIATSGTGYNAITLGGTSTDVIQTNLAGLSTGTSTSNSFVVSNFGTSTDIVDLSGGTLTSALGSGTAITLKTAYLNASGIQNLDTFTLNTTFVTGNSTTLANLTSAPNQQGVIFEFGMGSTTADFTTQAGINTAVTYITGSIGTTTTGSQSAVMAVSDGNSHQALFMFTDNGTSGITSSELKLIGVTSGTVLGATNFG